MRALPRTMYAHLDPPKRLKPHSTAAASAERTKPTLPLVRMKPECTMCATLFLSLDFLFLLLPLLLLLLFSCTVPQKIVLHFRLILIHSLRQHQVLHYLFYPTALYLILIASITLLFLLLSSLPPLSLLSSRGHGSGSSTVLQDGSVCVVFPSIGFRRAFRFEVWRVLQSLSPGMGIVLSFFAQGAHYQKNTGEQNKTCPSVARIPESHKLPEVFRGNHTRTTANETNRFVTKQSSLDCQTTTPQPSDTGLDLHR